MVANISEQIGHFHGLGLAITFSIRASRHAIFLAFDLAFDVWFKLSGVFNDDDVSALISDSFSSLSESSRITCGLSTNWAGGGITGGLYRTSSGESSLALFMVTKFSLKFRMGTIIGPMIS